VASPGSAAAQRKVTRPNTPQNTSHLIGFAVAEEDEPRLERLTQRFGNGNRSAFLREAMHQMEVVDRSGRLAECQAYGVERSAAAGLSHEDAVQVVRRALRRQ